MTDNVKITKEKLEKFISDSSVEFDLAEVEALMDAEVEKPEAEMDIELVDMCAAILAKAYNPGFEEDKPAQMYRPWEDEATPATDRTANAKTDKKKVVSLKRVLLVAAVLVVVFSFALPAGARLFISDELSGVIELCKDFFKINLNKDEPTTVGSNDLINQMILDSLNTLMLPEALLSDEYKKDVQTKQNEYMTTILVSVNSAKQDISGLITITQFKSADHNMTNGQVNVPENTFEQFKELQIDGQKIIVFSNDEKSYINYSDGATNYQVSLICDFDTMVSIAETINVKG